MASRSLAPHPKEYRLHQSANFWKFWGKCHRAGSSNCHNCLSTGDLTAGSPPKFCIGPLPMALVGQWTLLELNRRNMTRFVGMLATRFAKSVRCHVHVFINMDVMGCPRARARCGCGACFPSLSSPCNIQLYIYIYCDCTHGRHEFVVPPGTFFGAR